MILYDEIELIGERYYVKATAKICMGDMTVNVTAYAREPSEKKGMDLAQLTGATSSYARKYALNGLFAIDDTKDADTQDNREQMSPEPVDQKKINNCAVLFKKLIDEDQIEKTHARIKNGWSMLTNDEQMAVDSQLRDKAPSTKKMYKNLLKEYLNYTETK